MHGFALGLELQDRDARLEVGRLHVHAQAEAESALQPFLHAELLRRAIRRDHDLTLFLVQRVERVEELGLRLLPFGEELDVVDEQHIHVTVPRCELVALTLADRLDELGHEVLRRDVFHTQARCESVHVMADRDEEVRLPEPHSPVDEQRVVRLGRG